MADERPNIVIILADDLVYSDIGCFGGEISTPHLDRLAASGVRFTNFHNTPRCSPSRASLLTGLHPHQAGIGILTNDDGPRGYRGSLNDRCATAAEVLSGDEYATAITGKWHLAHDMRTPNGAWPTERGFDYFYGTLTGCGSYFQPGTLTRGTQNIEHEALDSEFFYTDRIADEAVGFLQRHRASEDPKPFFLYVPFTAPHWPLHTRAETIKRYEGVYEQGWDAVRTSRLERQKELGVVGQDACLTPRDPVVPAWEDEPNREWQTRRMQVYAAMVEEMDTAIGRILAELEGSGTLDDTIVVFLSDNGASADPVPLIDLDRFRERKDILRQVTRDGRVVRIGNDPTVMPGDEDTYGSYGKGWANASNTPFRLYKLWAHEGGVSTPLIVHWPAGKLAVGGIVDAPYQLVHLLPTLLEATGTVFPEERDGIPVHPLPGSSMLKAWRGETVEEPELLWWEHCGNAGIRVGRWKLVREFDWPWELYDVRSDRTEVNDLCDQYPDIVQDLSERWQRMAERVGVIPFRTTLDIYRRRGMEWRDAIG